MTWLMLAKMPLLISSRMMSAALTPISSASSLTVIESGMVTAPRADGSIVWTWLSEAASGRRCGLRGPLVLRVPLRLRAISSSMQRRDVAKFQSSAQVGRQRGGQRTLHRRPAQGKLPAGAIGAQVGTPTGHPAGGIERHLARRRPNHAHQLPLRPLGAACDAGAGGGLPQGGDGGYDGTSVASAGWRVRFR